MQRLVKILAAVVVFAGVVVAQQTGAVADVEFRITDAKGGPLQVAMVRVLQPIKGAGHRSVVGHDWRELAPKDFPGDFARVDDLPAGRYVLLVDEAHHALTLSEPFEVPAATAPQLTVRLQKGATLEGIVTDPAGKPLANVEVTTGVGGLLADNNPIAQMLRMSLVRTTTDATVRTARDGAFRFERVAAGDYRLTARCDAFATAQVPLVVGTETQKVPPIALEEGVVVTGTVTRDGKPLAGFEVLLQNETATVPDLKLGLTPVHLVALTEADGSYRLPERVPVRGTYAIMASDPKALKDRAAQIKATRRVVTMKAGTAPQVEDLQLPVQ
jgi:hypothetical protein